MKKNSLPLKYSTLKRRRRGVCDSSLKSNAVSIKKLNKMWEVLVFSEHLPSARGLG